MDIEQEARTLGWVPQEEFRGDTAKWVDAETFVQRGQEIMPLLKKNNERLKGELDATRQELNAIKTALDEGREALVALREFADESQKRAYEQAIKDLKAQERQARREGDTEAEDRAAEALEELQSKPPKPLPEVKPANAPAPAPSPDNTVNPDFVSWKQANPWVDTDAERTEYARSIAGYIRATTSLTGRAFLDKITEEVNQRFPSAGSPAPVNRTEGGSRPAPRGSRTYDNLPAEAKDACDRLASRLVGPNKAYKDVKAWRENYVKTYSWD